MGDPKSLIYLVAKGGIEPPTRGFSILAFLCSIMSIGVEGAFCSLYKTMT
jgi:hypothetical protein